MSAHLGPKDLHEQVGAPVHHLRMVGELWRRAHEALHLHHLLDLVQITAACGLHLTYKVEGAKAGRGLALFDTNSRTQRAFQKRVVRLLWDLTGDEEHVVSGPNPGYMFAAGAAASGIASPSSATRFSTRPAMRRADAHSIQNRTADSSLFGHLD
eukprot:CAMPEP_0181454514 /NCGR_PEP_ID=MMETSP1110-20121109/30278_1 /TAXON_ID=174948 /ORGANISM="Symbiodinium sp., Strain CCMP421" /LENGTH=154 /DNA_ID=CAMNT_0023578863 /DNA_START=42 /DNA_END=507 /DNA_ORIENTATION=+